MRRHHNPRYAPESLERKLSPSSIAHVPVAAEVYVSNQHYSDMTTKETPDTPTTPEPGDPPIDDPNIPVGPDVPA